MTIPKKLLNSGILKKHLKSQYKSSNNFCLFYKTVATCYLLLVNC